MSGRSVEDFQQFSNQNRHGIDKIVPYKMLLLFHADLNHLEWNVELIQQSAWWISGITMGQFH